MSRGLEVAGLTAGRGEFGLGPVDLHVGPGEATVVLGPSGAGKTTLLQAVAGFLPPRSGSVRLDGADLTRSPAERRNFGFVPPGLGLFPHRRVLENVGYALELRGVEGWRGRAGEWLARFGLEALAHAYPGRLSSGERQRVALARALAAEPRVLLWDEPLSALDVERRDELLRLLRGVLDTERIPLLLVTHDPPTAFALADRYLEVDGGTVRFSGPCAEYLARPRDRFQARFLGYENVWSADELDRAGPGSELARTLRAGAGTEGIAAPADAFVVGEGGSGGYPFEADRVQLMPGATLLWGRSGGLLLRARSEVGPERLRGAGTLRVRWEPSSARALERSTGGP